MRKTTESKSLEALKDSMFIDLTLDYGFKIVMADPDHTEFLLGLLNAIIPEREIVALEMQKEPYAAFRDRLLRRASVTMNESGLSDKPNWLFLQLSVTREPTPESQFHNPESQFHKKNLNFTKFILNFTIRLHAASERRKFVAYRTTNFKT